jgi:hypothetical protein
MFDTDVGEDREHSASFLYFTVLGYAVREAWLATRARDWTGVEATVQSRYRSKGGTRETMRVEVWYGYQFHGSHYAGRLIRDRALGPVQKVFDLYPEGKKVLVRVNPEKPQESYLSSGLGYIEPTLVGFLWLALLYLLCPLGFYMFGSLIDSFTQK